MLIQTDDNRVLEIPRWKRFALKDPFTNPRCRICFDKLNTHADIVFGDPWGMSNVDWEKGMSVVLTRTQEGETIISDMNSHRLVELHEAPLKEVVEGQLIEKRKRDVSVALAFYKDKGWLLPSYASQLNSSCVDHRLGLLINRYVNDAALSKDEIIAKNRSHLRKIQIKERLNSIHEMPRRIIRNLIKLFR